MTHRSARLKILQHEETYTDNLQLQPRKEHTQEKIDDNEEKTEESSGEDISPDLDALLHQDLGALEGDESFLIQDCRHRSRGLPALMSRSPLLSSSASEDTSAYVSIPSLSENTGLSPAMASGNSTRHRSNLESTTASGVGVSARQRSGLFEEIAPLPDNENGDEQAVDVDSENDTLSDNDLPDNSPSVASLLRTASITWSGHPKAYAYLSLYHRNVLFATTLYVRISSKWDLSGLCLSAPSWSCASATCRSRLQMSTRRLPMYNSKGHK